MNSTGPNNSTGHCKAASAGTLASVLTHYAVPLDCKVPPKVLGEAYKGTYNETSIEWTEAAIRRLALDKLRYLQSVDDEHRKALTEHVVVNEIATGFGLDGLRIR